MLPTGMIPKKKQDVDRRDLVYSTLFKANRYKDKVMLDVREIKDQRNFGTCVSFGVGYTIDNIKRQEMSTLFNYAETKKIDRFGMETEGTTGDYSLKVWKNIGGVPESAYPYSEYKEKMKFPAISPNLYNRAAENKIDGYVKIETKEELTDHLLHGNMATGGFTVGLTSFFNPEKLSNGDAVLDLPLGTIAGHQMAIIGIDHKMAYTYRKGITRTGFVCVAQSYGTGASRREFGTDDVVVWSESGYGWIPFDYVFGSMVFVDGHPTPYVNEIFVPLKNIPYTIKQIDPADVDITPYINKSRTMVPLRFIGETLGLNVEYHEGTQGIEITGNGYYVKVKIGSNQMIVNNSVYRLDASPKIKDGRTFVPLRAIAEAFDCEVQYFSRNQGIEIKKDNKIIELWIGLNEARLIIKE